MAQEQGIGSDGFGAGVLLGHRERGGHRTDFQVEKWDAGQIAWTLNRDYDDRRLIRPGAEPVAVDFARLGCKPFETFLEEDCNLILDAGWQYFMNGIAGTSITKLASGTFGRIGLGSGTPGGGYTDTALNSITNITGNNWKPLNAAPAVGSAHNGPALVIATQFATTEANDTTGSGITEFGVDGGSTAASTATATAPFISHGSASAGQKTSSQTWNVTVSYNFT